MPESPQNITEMSENRGWLSIHSLLGANRDAPVALVGAPLGLESLSPGRCDLAPGARPGGIALGDFFAAARMIGVHPKVKCVDLTAFDPSGDVGDIGALTAACWLAELLAGFVLRPTG